MILQSKDKSLLQVGSINEFLCTNVKSTSPSDQIGLKGGIESYIQSGTTSPLDHQVISEISEEKRQEKGAKKSKKSVSRVVKKRRKKSELWRTILGLFFVTCEVGRTLLQSYQIQKCNNVKGFDWAKERLQIGLHLQRSRCHLKRRKGEAKGGQLQA